MGFYVSLRTTPPAGSGSYDSSLDPSQVGVVFVHRLDASGRSLLQGSPLAAGGAFTDAVSRGWVKVTSIDTVNHKAVVSVGVCAEPSPSVLSLVMARCGSVGGVQGRRGCGLCAVAPGLGNCAMCGISACQEACFVLACLLLAVLLRSTH